MSYFPFKNFLFLAIPVIIQIAVVVGAIMLIRMLVHKNNENADNGPVSSRGAMRILDERFARGEIDEMEYIRKRDVLQQQTRR